MLSLRSCARRRLGSMLWNATDCTEGRKRLDQATAPRSLASGRKVHIAPSRLQEGIGINVMQHLQMVRSKKKRRIGACKPLAISPSILPLPFFFFFTTAQSSVFSHSSPATTATSSSSHRTLPPLQHTRTLTLAPYPSPSCLFFFQSLVFTAAVQ